MDRPPLAGPTGGGATGSSGVTATGGTTGNGGVVGGDGRNDQQRWRDGDRRDADRLAAA